MDPTQCFHTYKESYYLFEYLSRSWVKHSSEITSTTTWGIFFFQNTEVKTFNLNIQKEA